MHYPIPVAGRRSASMTGTAQRRRVTDIDIGRIYISPAARSARRALGRERSAIWSQNLVFDNVVIVRGHDVSPARARRRDILNGNSSLVRSGRRRHRRGAGTHIDTRVCCRREARPRLAVSTNVFYEEEGDFKVGAVLADNVTSLQVEAPHGKRSKVKAANVLVRFEGGGLGGFHGRGAASSPTAWTSISCGNAAARTSSPSTRWRATTSAARPWPSSPPALLVKLHGAPMYFYKKGKGRYKAAPPDGARRRRSPRSSASAGRRSRRPATSAQLTEGKLPPEFAPMLDRLLYAPDRQLDRVEGARGGERRSEAHAGAPDRALRRRCRPRATTTSTASCSSIFRAARRFRPARAAPGRTTCRSRRRTAFSIDDVTTTEIDDAFSVTPLCRTATLSVGIHIAAPALGIAPGSPVDAAARERLSTVYFPGRQDHHAAGGGDRRATRSARHRDPPALSLYVEIAPDFGIVSTATRVERVAIAANLRHDALEDVVHEGGARVRRGGPSASGAQLVDAVAARGARSAAARRQGRRGAGGAAGVQLLRRERPRAHRAAAAAARRSTASSRS